MDEKYYRLLDEETLAFIRQTDEFYPADAVNFSIEKQRQFYDALCQEFDAGYPDTVHADDRLLNTPDAEIPVRQYTVTNQSRNAHVVYIHGGGFILGGLNSHDSICADLCQLTGLGVTAIDYRLAPENKHPAAFNDARNAYLEISRQEQTDIILVGDSAGGNLAAAVSHAERGGNSKPAGQVLIYPALGADISKGSFIEHAQAPMLTTDDMKFYEEVRMQPGYDRRDVRVSPLCDSDFSNLPPTVVFSAQCDPLADDGEQYRAQIRAAGGKAAWINATGLVHGYLRARSSVKRAARSFERIVSATRMLADKQWDYD